MACKEKGRRGAQRKYSDIAIETALTIKLVFNLPLRQTQGFMHSLVKLMRLSISIPDYTTLSRRMTSLTPTIRTTKYKKHTHIIIDSSGLTVYGADEWHKTGRGKRKFQGYRKINIALNEKQEILACELTDKHDDDMMQLPKLFSKIHFTPKVVMADGGYDSRTVYQFIKEKFKPTPSIVIPPRTNGRWRKWTTLYTKERSHHLETIKQHGRMYWQKTTNYGKRSLVEVAFHRYKKIIGHRMHSLKFANQKIEALLACKALNIMSSLGMPETVRTS